MNLYCSECGANIMWVPPSRALPETLKHYCPHCDKTVSLTTKAPESNNRSPTPIPKARELLMITDEVANFQKVTGVVFCRVPETTRTTGSTQIHIQYHTEEIANEAWIPLDNPYGIRFHKTTGHNMSITSEIIGLRARILDLEKQILEKIDQLQDEITDENIDEYLQEEKSEDE